jgi:hypothetical protein
MTLFAPVSFAEKGYADGSKENPPPDAGDGSMPTNALYDKDFYAWANEQVALLRSGDIAAADIEHLAEEIESMGRTEKRELVNRLAVLFLHLLKWQFQPALRGNSWRLSVEEQRYRLAAHLDDNPSLKSKLDQAIHDAYRLALIEAEKETGLARAVFPATCQWSFGQVMDEDFWPEGQ